jgi:hypothetical protein
MKRQRGQVLVIFVVALVSLLLMAGLLIDGGTAWAEMRHVQNAADAAARAGAIVLAERAVDGDNGGNPADPTWGARVYNEVHLSAIRNSVTVERATYTDRQGNLLSGKFVDGGAVPAGAAGVEVLANRAFRTHLVRLAGFDEWRVGRAATAIAGPTAGCYDTLTGCELLPITFPVTILACGQGNTSVLDPDGNQWATGEEVTVPLCGGNPGSVGWIDWTPPSGGTDELEEVILDPPPQDIPLPSWKYITETGDISAAYVEDALNTYAGDVVLFPMFDSTCNTEPSNNQLDGCPPENTGGSGVNQWYHISHFLFFQLAYPKGAFVNGDNSVACAAANAKECIKGAFVQLLGEGGVIECPPEGCPRGTSYTVQLIR